MVTPDHDRRTDLTRLDELVELQPGAVAFPVAQPADARRQALVAHPLAGEPDPPGQRLVLREQVQNRLVGTGDVARIPGQRRPPERPATLAEQRPDVGGYETRERERPCETGELCLAADRVAVVEHLRAAIQEAD